MDFYVRRVIASKKRARGETLLALNWCSRRFGRCPVWSNCAGADPSCGIDFRTRWTPPGAIAFALTHGLNEGHLVVTLSHCWESALHTRLHGHRILVIAPRDTRWRGKTP